MKIEKFYKPEFFGLDKDKDEDILKEEWLQIKDIREGEIFFECECGKNYQLEAVEDAKEIDNGWICKVKDSSNKIFEFFISANTEYKKINLFRIPQIISINDNGDIGFFVE